MYALLKKLIHSIKRALNRSVNVVYVNFAFLREKICSISIKFLDIFTIKCPTSNNA